VIGGNVIARRVINRVTVNGPIPWAITRSITRHRPTVAPIAAFQPTERSRPMTTIAHPAIDHPRRATLRQLVRRWAAAGIAVVRVIRTRSADAIAAGQLGPAAETEVGRWTGARV
jgi:hypothetical protein